MRWVYEARVAGCARWLRSGTIEFRRVLLRTYTTWLQTFGLELTDSECEMMRLSDMEK